VADTARTGQQLADWMAVDLDAVVPCGTSDCDREAVAIMQCTACKATAARGACDVHKAEVEADIRAHAARGIYLSCRTCHAHPADFTWRAL
jgi:hypothetical protein